MDVHSIFTKDSTGNELVKFAQQTAQTLVHNTLTRSQIRNIFAEVRKIETLWEGTHKPEALRRLNMLKPKLYYQTARNESVKVLKDVLCAAIDEINNAPDDTERNKRFHRFVDLFEAILAYHYSKVDKN